MPHYADGTPAKVGDVVQGRGYNVEHDIIGKVVNVREGESCTLTIAYVGDATQVFFLHSRGHNGHELLDCHRPFAPATVLASMEYGDTKSFKKIA